MPRDSAPQDPLKDALYRWLDPEGLAARSDPNRVDVVGRDRARLETIVSESSADHRRVVDVASVRRVKKRASRTRRWAWPIAAVILAGVVASIAIVACG